MLMNRKSQQDKGITLLLKILSKIINNPTQTQKYGDLHLQKISQKLSHCKPGMRLLLLSGFKKSQNNKRLIWANTDENMKLLKHIHTKLSVIINTVKSTNEEHQIIKINNDQTKSQTQFLSNLNAPMSTVCYIFKAEARYKSKIIKGLGTLLW